MKIFKPSWVSHDGNPIFSVDIHPDGSRFATGGQGPDKCGRVIIWNMAPLLNEKDENRDNVPKILCQLDNHLACINCVRWSNNGKYLASAGDDKNLMIWQIAGRFAMNHYSHSQHMNSTFGAQNIEQWRCVTTLHGHNGDILDLAWSPDDSCLASCSVDNMIVVWDAKNFPQILTKITGHTGLVKGVAWDPIGKYLASQSDDKTVRIWRTNDWKEEVLIDEPFRECGGTTHVLRLDWSPDGQLLVSAHAMNNCGSVAQIIERDGWTAKRDFVGHRKAVTCVRFNPHIIGSNSTSNAANGNSSKAKSSGKTVKYCCAAIGSRDRSLSVWLTNQPRPLAVAHDLFESSVLDISWSLQNMHLIACSQDGSVAVLIFSRDELGRILTPDEKLVHQQKLYGKSVGISWGKQKQTLLAEDPDIFKAQTEHLKATAASAAAQQISNQQQQQNLSQNGFEAGHGNESNSQYSHQLMVKNPTDKQIETLMPGGRRRITPLYIPPIMNYDGSPQPFNQNSDSITFSSSKESKTRIMIEVRDDSRSSAATNSSPLKNISTCLSTGNATPGTPVGMQSIKIEPPIITVPDSPPPQSSNVQANESVQKNEKSTQKLNENQNSNSSTGRPTPNGTDGNVSKKLSMQNNESANPKFPQSSVQNKVDGKRVDLTTFQTTCQSGVKRKLGTETLLSGSNTGPKKGKTSQTTAKSAERENATLNGSKSTTGKVDRLAGTMPLIQAPQAQLKSNNFAGSSMLLSAGSALPGKVTKKLLPAMCIEKCAEFKVVDHESGRTFTLEVENNCGNKKIFELRCMDDTSGSRTWDTLVSQKICALNASLTLTVIICIDNSLHIYETLSGRRVRPPLILNCAPSHLALQRDCILIVTTHGEFYLWNFSPSATKKTIISGDSIAHLLVSPTPSSDQKSQKSKSENDDNTSGGVDILNCSLTEQMQPLLLLSSGKALIYDLDLRMWTLLSDTNDMIAIWSEQKSSLSAITRTLPQQIVDSHDKQTLLKKILPLATVQSQHSVDIRRYSQVLNRNSSIGVLQHVATRSFLDQQLASALALKSSHEYKYWLLQSVSHFVENNCELRLRQLCTELMSSLMSSSTQSTTEYDDTKILGLCKRQILHEILAIIAPDLRYQRLYAEFRQQLEFATTSAANTTANNDHSVIESNQQTGVPPPASTGGEIDSVDQSSL